MAFEYQRQKDSLHIEAQTMVSMVERIGQLVRSTGVFRIGEVLTGDSWTCLLMLYALRDAGLIVPVEQAGLTQDHIYTSHTFKGG
jgi:hypothetical protein